MYDDIALFIHIVQARGLASAAQQLDIPPPTVTRRLKKLEQQLGCQLIHRSARQFRLTAEGEVYYSAFADLVNDFDVKTKGLSQQMQSLQGQLTVLAPTNISIGYLQPMWSEFIARYPDIQLNLKLNNENKDIISEQADIALRIGPQKDSQLYQIGLGAIPTFLVASPDYLASSPILSSLDDINQHRCITSIHLKHWQLEHRDTKETVDVHPKAALRVDDINIASQFAADGHGLALLPVSETVQLLKERKLTRVLTEWHGPNRELYLIWPSGKLLGAKASCLKQHIQDYLANALANLKEIG